MHVLSVWTCARFTVLTPTPRLAHWKVTAYVRKGREPNCGPPDAAALVVIFDVPAPCDKSFATSIEVEFFEPLYVGDVVTCTGKLVDINHKELKVGKGAFLRQEDIYTKQTGEVIAVSYLDIFRFVTPVGGSGS